MITLLSSLVALLPAMILIFGLIAVFCVLLFDMSPAHGETQIIRKLNKSRETEYYIYNVGANSNATQEDIEFNTADLLVKLAKEISPDSNVCLKISPKKRISPEVNPRNNKWRVQKKTDVLEDSTSDEESYVLTCEKLDDNCVLMTYTDQNEPTGQNLQDILWTILEIICGTSQKTDDMRTTNVSKKRKPRKVAKANPRRQQK